MNNTHLFKDFAPAMHPYWIDIHDLIIYGSLKDPSIFFSRDKAYFWVKRHRFEHKNFPIEVIPIESFSHEEFTKQEFRTPVRRKLFKTKENAHFLPPFISLKYWECPPYFEIPMPKHWDFPNVWLVAVEAEPYNLFLVQEDEEGKVMFSSISNKQYQEQLHAKKKNQEPPFFINWV